MPDERLVIFFAGRSSYGDSLAPYCLARSETTRERYVRRGGLTMESLAWHCSRPAAGARALTRDPAAGRDRGVRGYPRYPAVALIFELPQP